MTRVERYTLDEEHEHNVPDGHDERDPAVGDGDDPPRRLPEVLLVAGLIVEAYGRAWESLVVGEAAHRLPHTPTRQGIPSLAWRI